MADVAQSPGWYPDPEGGTGQRWWNGVSWSESRRADAPPPRVVYSAANPAPQAPTDPAGVAAPGAASTLNTRVNPMAVYGLVTGIVAVVANVLLVPSILAIVFSLKGLTRARELAAAGETNTVRTPAVIGLVLGILGALGGVIQVVVFLASISTNISITF